MRRPGRDGDRAFAVLELRGLPYAAVEAFAVFCWAVTASSRRISESFFWTCSEKMYCAGRCLERSISGAIGPEVLMPRSATFNAFNGWTTAAFAAVGS